MWWKWLPVANIVALVIPDGLVDLLPGSYGKLDESGGFQPNYKDWALSLAKGDVYMGSIPMLDGHIWDSLFRVLVAMFLVLRSVYRLAFTWEFRGFANLSLIR